MTVVNCDGQGHGVIFQDGDRLSLCLSFKPFLMCNYHKRLDKGGIEGMPAQHDVPGDIALLNVRGIGEMMGRT